MSVPVNRQYQTIELFLQKKLINNKINKHKQSKNITFIIFIICKETGSVQNICSKKCIQRKSSLLHIERVYNQLLIRNIFSRQAVGRYSHIKT